MGKEFVCGSVEEMPDLVYKYFTDRNFYETQKELAMKNTRAQLEVDGAANFKKLCELVQRVTLEKEEAYEE